MPNANIFRYEQNNTASVQKRSIKRNSLYAGFVVHESSKTQRPKGIMKVALCQRICLICLAALCIFFFRHAGTGMCAKAEAMPNVGDTMLYGNYEQDNDASDGREPIEWIVLASDGSTATMISRYGLDCKPFHNEYLSAPWEYSSLREWLNGEFLNAAFSPEEKAGLMAAMVPADGNPNYDTNPGNDTEDKVYLLSIQEAKSVFPAENMIICHPTPYAEAQGAEKGEEGGCWWWLRSPGNWAGHAAFVYVDGGIDGNSCPVNYDKIVVRPVIVISLSR